MNFHVESSTRNSSCVKVNHSLLLKVQEELKQLKNKVTKLSNVKSLDLGGKLKDLHKESTRLNSLLVEAEEEKTHWKARLVSAQSEAQRYHEEIFTLQCELKECSEKLTQQSDYCASMGSTCCTLLWRVSKCENCMQTLIHGSKVDNFFSLVASTVEAFIQTYADDEPEDSGGDETQFVLALCGIITNIAASPVGREFLMQNSFGREVVDAFSKCIGFQTGQKCQKIKCLMLMALYNCTINQKGLMYISSKSHLLPVLTNIIKDCNSEELQFNCLRLLQSFVCETTNLELASQVKRQVPWQVLQTLSRSRCAQVKDLATELQADLGNISSEP